MQVLTVAPKDMFRLVGSDSNSIWHEKDYKRFNNAKKGAQRKIGEGLGYNVMSVFNDLGQRLFSGGLTFSAERSIPTS